MKEYFQRDSMIEGMRAMYPSETYAEAFVRFCHHCGHALEAHDGHAIGCQQCGHVRYVNVSATVGVIIRDELSRVLLAVRGRDPFKGSLDTLGGFIEEGETPEEAACREIREELGVEIKDLKYIGSFPDMYMYSGLSIPLLGINFEAKLCDPHAELRPQDDIADVRWYSINQIPFEEIQFPSIRAILEKLQKEEPLSKYERT